MFLVICPGSVVYHILDRRPVESLRYPSKPSEVIGKPNPPAILPYLDTHPGREADSMGAVDTTVSRMN